jgi:hypothetical protein
VQGRERGIAIRLPPYIRGRGLGEAEEADDTPAAPSSSSARSESEASISAGSHSCRTMPNGKSRSSSVARERSTRIPLSAAAARAAASNEVFPIPAGPSTTMNVPLPEHALPNADSIRASSSLRSSSGPVTAAPVIRERA